MENSTASNEFIFYILNGFGVTWGYLFANIATAVLGMIIIYLNYLVIVTLIKRSDALELADTYVVSLAGADTLTGVLLVYNTFYNMINYQSADECRFRNGLLILVAICSGLHLLALAIDRWLKVIRPLHYAILFTKRKVMIICIGIWFSSLLIGLLPTFGWKNDFEESNNDSVLCTFFGTMDNDYILLVNLLMWTSVFLMLLVYISIFRIAHRHARLIQIQQKAINNRPSQCNEISHSWKFTKTISIIVGLYVFMWMPTGVVFIIHLQGILSDFSNTEKGTLLLYVSTPAFLNSLLDPIIYALKIRCVRKIFREKFLCCRPKSEAEETEFTNNRVVPFRSTEMTETTNF
ncbi:hypothetical protein FSP39_008883 [Pinctada imbricata]|uniref:G-protein coupled receptors family 1 profile domain-containing protein n=1 Tax=Pinctada imbricata TaxID=66713 RepID=A0AA89C0X6_PINIB|nr:hypothetical protein FSP39_008883 [Pinctada imbricata]